MAAVASPVWGRVAALAVASFLEPVWEPAGSVALCSPAALWLRSAGSFAGASTVLVCGSKAGFLNVAVSVVPDAVAATVSVSTWEGSYSHTRVAVQVLLSLAHS